MTMNIIMAVKSLYQKTVLVLTIMLRIVRYSMDENLDHKIGIYCNLIGPLAELRHSAFSCKKVPRYFGKFRHQSNVRIIQYDWLIVLYIFIPLVRIASFLIIKTVVSRKNSLMSTHLWFVHLLN